MDITYRKAVSKDLDDIVKRSSILNEAEVDRKMWKELIDVKQSHVAEYDQGVAGHVLVEF